MINSFLTRIARPTARTQRGQVLILFAMCLLIIFGMAAVAVDGGYGLVQARRAQNAADFGAVAGTKTLVSLCSGGNPPSDNRVHQEIQDVIDRNSAAVGTSWTAYYLDGSGKYIPSGSTTSPQPLDAQVSNLPAQYPPTTACGVSVQLTPTWTPYLAGVLGQTSMTTTASAKSIVTAKGGTGAAIVALDQVTPHQVLGGGQGSQFNVVGTIYADSTVPYDPWTQNHNGYNYNDVVDAKDNSNLILKGNMETVGGSWPLDWCFAKDKNGNYPGSPPYNLAVPSPRPVGAPNPYNTAVCTGGTGAGKVNLQYDHIDVNQPPLPDPLLPSSGAGLPDPFHQSPAADAGFTLGLCPGEQQPTARTIPPAVNGKVTLLPGEYKNAVILQGVNVDFADCSGAFDPTQSTLSVYPGVFRFDSGLLLEPGAGQTAQGNNVMIATSGAVPVPGNVPGVVSGNVFTASGPGNGAPCFPTTDKKGNILFVQTSDSPPKNETNGSNRCGGTQTDLFNRLPGGPYDGVLTYNQTTFKQDAATYGTGTNFSLMLGGSGVITLNSPNTGQYRDIALMQQRDVPGNFGFNAGQSNSAAITVNGVVYDASEICNGLPKLSNGKCSNLGNLPLPDPIDYWDVGIPFQSGGVMQAGLGTGQNYPTPSKGSVTVNGPCVVGSFNTDGGTDITIDGNKNVYALPGVAGSGIPPVIG